jgi:hypothetical protein
MTLSNTVSSVIIMLNFGMPRVTIYLFIVMLNVAVLSVGMLNFIMLSVVVLSVVAPILAARRTSQVVKTQSKRTPKSPA